MLKLLNFEFKHSHTIEHSKVRISHEIISHSKFLSFFKLLLELFGAVQLKFQLVLFPDWLPSVVLFIGVGKGLVFELEVPWVVVLFEGLIFWQLLFPELSIIHWKPCSILQTFEHPSPFKLFLSSHSSSSTFIPSPHLGVQIFVVVL